MKKILLTLLLLSTAALGFAQRITDKIDRGLVAVPSSTGGMLVSWRVLGEEYYDVTYNLYKNGTLLKSGLTTSNYSDASGNSSSKYSVSAVVRGKEQAQSAQITPWANGYKQINVKPAYDRNGKVSSNYALNDISLADVNGDGVVEFIVKRPCSVAADPAQKTEFHHVDCYDIKGNQLWWIDMGPNMLSGADEQWDVVGYDWDQDGKAEILLRGQDNMIIHHADGTETKIGSQTVDTRWSGIEYTSSGNEYLLYLEGSTGKPYQIGPSSHPDYMDYPNPRGNDEDWGKGIVGHRSTKHYFGAPFLDGRHASIFLGRGAYTKHMFKAFDVDPVTHQLTKRWEWNSASSGVWFGQGYHNYAVGDVDWDGKDEIIFGSMIIDDNGKGLSTTGLGHGDAQHCSDLDPYRKYEEQFACNESSPAMNYRNAVTSEFYYRKQADGDDGRALCANFTNDYPGCVGRSVSTGWISTVADKEISALGGDAFISWGDLNQRIYWDGDLCDEYFDSPGTEGYGAIYKPTTKSASGGRWNFPDSKCNNWSKNNPGAIADIFGDWREELVMRKGDNSAILVYTTGIPTTYRIPTLWSDHQYRNAMVWESLGYNQPPHKSYFLGQMEGITQAPPTNTMTDRKEIANGGEITSVDEHLIICETNDTKISIKDGAAPYMVTFNVPSNVEGTGQSGTTAAKPTIKYSYYTCDVTGGALTGNMRLVKQGDGILNLPKVDMTYTGETNIWNGTLNFDGTMLNSKLWLNRFAELNSDGGKFKSIKADYGSVIRPGGIDNVGEITADSALTLGFGSRIVLDLYSEGLKADKINTKKLTIEKKTWEYGPKYLVPVIEIKEHMLDGESTLAAGDYIIGRVEELNGSLATFKIEGITNLRAGLSIDANNNLVLSLGAVRGASEIVWSGLTSNTWDYANTENFYVAADEAQTPDVFVEKDIVNFTDASSKLTVSIKDDIPADTVIVNSTKSYTFNGTGKIISGSFVKEGTGTVTMNNDNTYKGGNYLKGGTVKVSALSNSVTAYGNLGAVTTSLNKFTMENGAVLQSTATVTNGSPIKFIGTEGGVINNSADFVQEKALSGTLLTKKGNGWLKTSVANSSLNKLIIAAGTVDAGNAPAKEVEMQGTSYATGSGFLTVPIIVAKGAKATLTTVNRATSTSTLTGEGQITILCATEKGTNYYATRSPMQFNLSKFQGTLVAGATYTADGRFTFNTSTGGDGWKLDIPSGIIVQNSGKTLRIGQLTGKGTLGGGCAFSNGATVAANTWQVGNDEDFKFDGVVTSSDKFTKMGTGKMTTTGVWDCTGAININAGELHFNSGSTLGTGTLTVAKGATLTGVSNSLASSASKTPVTNSSVTINGTFQVGSTSSAASGAVDFGGKNVTFGTTGVYRTGIRKAGTDPATAICAISQNIKTLKFNTGSKISVFFTNSYVPEVGDEYLIFNNVTTITGTPTVECDVEGYSFDTSRISEGIIKVTAVPTIIDCIKDIPAFEMVQVEVVSLGGYVINQFTCPMSDVDATFRKSDAPKGVYMLRINGTSGKGTKKVMK